MKVLGKYELGQLNVRLHKKEYRILASRDKKKNSMLVHGIDV